MERLVIPMVRTTTLTGGEGATLKAKFDLEAGDVLHFIVGGRGNVTNSTANDGTGGAGGGGNICL